MTPLSLPHHEHVITKSDVISLQLNSLLEVYFKKDIILTVIYCMQHDVLQLK